VGQTTSIPGTLLVAVSILILYVAISTELAVAHTGVSLPRAVEFLARRSRRRAGRWSWADIAVSVPFLAAQFIMIDAIIDPARVAGPAGAVIGALELIAAAVWTALLCRWWLRSQVDNTPKT
jgi:hypothetical protein